MDPSKPTEGELNQSTSIPRSREAKEEVLEGEIINRGVPLTRPTVDADPNPPLPRKRGRARTVLVVLLGVSALICAGGLVTGYVLYHNISEPDRGTPTTTLDQYLDAKFSLRDDQVAKRFECSSPSLDAIDDLRRNILDRETKFGVKFDVRSANLDILTSGGSAMVNGDLDLSTSYQGSSQREIEKWHFTLVNQGGWRVCGASKLS